MPRFTEVNALRDATPAEAQAVIEAAMAVVPPPPPIEKFEERTITADHKPGVDRWDVKTGADLELDGFRPYVVDTTVEHMIAFPREHDMPLDATLRRHRRVDPVEFTVWRIEADVVGILLEGDGDYHLELQSPTNSAHKMVAEIPYGEFIKRHNPWRTNIMHARDLGDQLYHKWHPRVSDGATDGAMLSDAADAVGQPDALEVTPPPGMHMSERLLTGAAVLPPTRVRITGPGFFDADHGQNGGSETNSIEIHPVLKLELL